MRIVFGDEVHGPSWLRMLEMRAETPFSTWMRVFTSMRKGSPRRVTIHSQVPTLS